MQRSFTLTGTHPRLLKLVLTTALLFPATPGQCVASHTFTPGLVASSTSQKGGPQATGTVRAQWIGLGDLERTRCFSTIPSLSGGWGDSTLSTSALPFPHEEIVRGLWELLGLAKTTLLPSPPQNPWPFRPGAAGRLGERHKD